MWLLEFPFKAKAHLQVRFLTQNPIVYLLLISSLHQRFLEEKKEYDVLFHSRSSMLSEQTGQIVDLIKTARFQFTIICHEYRFGLNSV